MKTQNIRSLHGVYRYALLSLGLAAASVWAQEKQTTSNDEVIAMDKFVVQMETDSGYGTSKAAIGTRTVKPVLEVPSSIYVVNKEIIDDLGATYGSQAIKYVSPGAIPEADTSGDGSRSRGFNTGTLRDGTRLLWYKHMPMYDVERIEIIKGPSNMLIGGDASFSGDSINYVTKRPTLERMSDIKLTVGNHSYLRAEANTSGPLMVNDDITALYRVTVGGESGTPVRPLNKTDQKFFGSALSFKYGDRVRVDVNMFYLIDNSNDYWPSFLDINKSVAFGPAYLNANSTETFIPASSDQFLWDTTWLAFNAAMVVNLTENSSTRISYSDMQGNDQRWQLRGIAVQPDNVTLNRQDIVSELGRGTKSLQVEYLHSLKRDAWSNDFQVGGEYGWIYDSTKNTLATPPPLNTNNPDYSYKRPTGDFDTIYWNLSLNSEQSTLVSYWLQDNITLLNDKLILVGGLRWSDRYKTSEVGNPVVLPGNLTVPYGSTVTKGDLIRTHRYGVVYKPTDWLAFHYADASNATPVAGVSFDGSPYKDSEGTLSEAGVKFTKKGDRFDVFGSFTYFDMAQTNIRTSEIDNSVPGVCATSKLPRIHQKDGKLSLGFV